MSAFDWVNIVVYIKTAKIKLEEYCLLGQKAMSAGLGVAGGGTQYP